MTEPAGQQQPTRPRPDTEGGDPACWLGQVCPECGRFSEQDAPARCPHCGAEMSD